jgi:hypothetical protein
MAGIDRESLGSWLSGPRAAAEAQGIGLGYPGERLGLPAQGPGSVSGWGRRFAALFLDWFVALGITRLLFPSVETSTFGYSLVVLAVFAAHTAILGALLHASFGQRLMGLRLIPVATDGPPQLHPARILARAVLVATVLPAVLYDRDRRGLPDHVARTVLVNVR